MPPAEKERRKRLHDERVRRKKREQRLFWYKIILTVLAVLLLISVSFFLAFSGHIRAMCVYDTVWGLIAVTLTDRSGIRELLFAWYPERFPFAGFLKKHVSDRSFGIELARTLCYYALGAMLLWERLYTACALVCVAAILIGYVYLIFDQDDRYTFDKFSKCSDTPMYLIVAGVLGLANLEGTQLDIPVIPIAVGSVLVTAAYLLFAKSEKKIERAFEMLFFSALDFIAIVMLVKQIRM